MHLELNDEQRAVRATVREFAEGEIAPHAGEWDLAGAIPSPVVRQLGELGVMGLPFPERYGGVGAGSLAMAVALEELARVDSSVAITVGASVSLGGTPLLFFGSEAQKERWLVPLARGETVGAFASTEPSAGSDVQGIQTTAQLVDDHWLVNGAKAYITNAGTELSAFAITTAITAQRDEGARPEISTLIVPTDAPGFRPQRPYEKMGWHASDTRELVYEDCRVAEDALLGPRGAGPRQFLITLEGGRVGVGAMGVGLAQGCLDRSLRMGRAALRLWPTDRPVPGDRLPARRAEDEDRRGPRPSSTRQPRSRMPVGPMAWKRRRPSSSPASSPSRPPTSPCRCTVATGTWKNRPSRAITATPKS